jgi:hypothetical protein
MTQDDARENVCVTHESLIILMNDADDADDARMPTLSNRRKFMSLETTMDELVSLRRQVVHLDAQCRIAHAMATDWRTRCKAEIADELMAEYGE